MLTGGREARMEKVAEEGPQFPLGSRLCEAGYTIVKMLPLTLRDKGNLRIL